MPLLVTESFELPIPDSWKLLGRDGSAISLFGSSGEEIQISVAGLAGRGTKGQRNAIVEKLRQRALLAVREAAIETGQSLSKPQTLLKLRNGLMVDRAEYSSPERALAQYVATSDNAILLLTIASPAPSEQAGVEAESFLESVRTIAD